MTKSTARLIQVCLNAKNFKLAARLAMLNSFEYDRVVNLDNAYSRVEQGMTRIEWRNALSQLAKDGIYKAMGGEFNGFYGTLAK